MTEPSHDTGVIMALVERFETQRLPRALEIKGRVDKGERLSDLDIAFLEDVLADSRLIKPLVDKHPEWQALVSRAVDLYHEITQKALENEKAAH